MSSYADLGLIHFGIPWNDTRLLTRDQWEFVSRQIQRLKGASSAEDRKRVLDDVDKVRKQEEAFLATVHPMSKSVVESYIKVLSSVFFPPDAPALLSKEQVLAAFLQALASLPSEPPPPPPRSKGYKIEGPWEFVTFRPSRGAGAMPATSPKPSKAPTDPLEVTCRVLRASQVELIRLLADRDGREAELKTIVQVFYKRTLATPKNLAVARRRAERTREILEERSCPLRVEIHANTVRLIDADLTHD
ncbi:MAG: hypothetical protein ACHRXM_02025 [Isosphaerales bacterium]